MKLELLPDGRPGQHLGISHLVKHYLNPEQMWEDVADELEEGVRPRSVLEAHPELGHQVWKQATAPGEALTRAWSALRVPYHEGYGKLLQQLASALPDPHDQGWLPQPDGRYCCHAGLGILLTVIEDGPDWQLYTAYRPANFRLTDYDCPPRDPQSVRLRRKIAEAFAQRRFAAKHGGTR